MRRPTPLQKCSILYCSYSWCKGRSLSGSPYHLKRYAIVQRIENAGTKKVWSNVPYLDIHSYRSDYCCTIYHIHARLLEDIPKKQRYVCRCNLEGVIYDKLSIVIANQALGHNRNEVIASSYLR